MADSSTKTLELVFITESSKEVTVVVKDPKDGLTLAEAQAVMACYCCRIMSSNRRYLLSGM